MIYRILFFCNMKENSSCNTGGRGTQLFGVLAVVGGFLVHLSLGTVYTTGNMIPYITSYIRAFSEPKDLKYAVSSWLFATRYMSTGISMFFGGILKNKLGSRLTTLLGGWIMSLGIFLTAFTVKVSFGLTMLTFGLISGVGCGIAYASPLACAMKWQPAHKGLVNGIVVAGFGAGAFVFDQVQTAFINPHNLLPDQKVGSETYFSEEVAGDVLKQVPLCFLLLGSCYAILQFVGSMLLFDPPEQSREEITLLEVGQEDNEPITSHTVSSVEDVHPLDALKTRAFYTLWAIFFLNGQAIVFISSVYKTFGQTFIHDDHFLAIVGSFASVFNSVGRIVWGQLADKTSFRFAMLLLCSLMMVLMLTLIGAERGGKAMFFIWICLIFFTFSGSFVLLPTATAKAFGQRYVAINYGLIFSSQVVTAPLGAVLVSLLVSKIHWFGMFCLVSSFTGINWLLTFFFRKKHAGKPL